MKLHNSEVLFFASNQNLKTARTVSSINPIKYFTFPYSAGTYLPQLTALASLFLHVAPLAGKIFKKKKIYVKLIYLISRVFFFCAGALALLSGGEEEQSYGHTGSSHSGSGTSSGYGGHGRAGHFRRKPGKKRYQKRYYRSIRNNEDSNSNIDDFIGKKSRKPQKSSTVSC